jgi:putative ABC transport system permease protein
VGHVAEIPGVGQVQTRVVVNVSLDVPGLKEPAVGRLVSIPDREAPGLNGLYLRRGRYIQPGNEGEVLASEGFVRKHRLQPGDTVTAVINGRKRLLRIVGVALSPEYVYSIREGDILPDDLRYGVFWMGYTELAAAFDMQGAFNDLALTLTPGASEADVLSRIDRPTEPYGGLGAYGRADQPSHKFVSNEINELRGMALVTPSIFLAVAAFILNVVISRLVNTQREQIAALKAFGYTRWEVGWHYLKLVVVVVAVGVALGTLLGARLGRASTEMYTNYFHFPVFEFHLSAGVVLLAWAIRTGAAAKIADFELELAKAALVRSRPRSPGDAENWQFQIRSPITGCVLEVFLENAKTIPAGTELLKVGDPTDLECVIDVLSTDGVKVRQALKALPEVKVLLER